MGETRLQVVNPNNSQGSTINFVVVDQGYITIPGCEYFESKDLVSSYYVSFVHYVSYNIRHYLKSAPGFFRETTKVSISGYAKHRRNCSAHGNTDKVFPTRLESHLSGS